MRSRDCRGLNGPHEADSSFEHSNEPDAARTGKQEIQDDAPCLHAGIILQLCCSVLHYEGCETPLTKARGRPAYLLYSTMSGCQTSWSAT